MKIIVLHWHGTCPHCGKYSCIFVHFYKTLHIKMPSGYECGSCGELISDDEQKVIEDWDNSDICPKIER